MNYVTTWHAMSRVPRAWDEGITSRTSVVAGPLEQPFTVAFVRDDHLRVTNGTVEDAYISRLIRVSTRMAERWTGRALMPQTRELVLSGFPYWRIVVPRPPLIEVLSVEYSSGGSMVELDPSAYQVDTPRGPTCRKGVIIPASGTSWPSADQEAIHPVRVQFRCGYVDGSSPEQAEVPEDILHAQLLLIGEFYKQRSESVQGVGMTVNPTVMRARQMLREYHAF